MKKTIFVIAILAVFVFAAAAQAVVSTSTIRQQIKDTRQEVLQQIKDKRVELKAKIDGIASSTKAVIAQRREALKIKIEEKKAQLKEKLKLIKDERKKNIVERIDEQLRKLNERMTEHFLAVLTQLEKVLNNIKARADKAETAGKNVAAVRTAILEAQNLIDSTRESVKAQAGKLYNVTISGDEGKLKAEVGAARQTLHTDLAAVRKLVQAAREAVHKAATILGQIPGIDEDENLDNDSNASNQ